MGLRLAEVFNVVYRGIVELKPDQQIGTIKVDDGVCDHYIYDIDNAESIKTSVHPMDEIVLTGPTNAPIRADASLKFDVNLFCGAYKESFEIPDCTNEDDLRLCAPLEETIVSKDGRGAIDILYAIYKNSVEAHLEVKLLNKFDLSMKLYGVIAASNSKIERPEWASMIFVKKPDDMIIVAPCDVFPLARSIVAVPINSEFYLDIHLYSEDGHDIFEDTVMFQTAQKGTESKFAVGENCNIEVKVTWQGAEDEEARRLRRLKITRSMGTVNGLRRQYVDFLISLYHKGLLDDQFLQMQKLQDESNPDFVNEVVTLFFEDSEKLIQDLAIALDQQHVDYNKIDACVHQFEGSSSRIGAKRVRDKCVAFRACYDAKNLEGCLKCLEQVKYEYYLVKRELQTVFRLEQQIVAAGGSIPMIR